MAPKRPDLRPDVRPEVRDVTAGDSGTLLKLNNASSPELGELGRAAYDALLGWAVYARAIAAPPVAFLVALERGAPYSSPNYSWFAARYESFLYVDRIAVAASERGKGLGARLYDDLDEFGAGKYPIVACEVNLRPRNDVSLAFHAARGFEAVGTQETEQGTKTVQLMIKSLAGG